MKSNRRNFLVGEVYQLGTRLLMVSSIRGERVLFGAAQPEGKSYRMIGTPLALTSKERKQLALVADTER